MNLNNIRLSERPGFLGSKWRKFADLCVDNIKRHFEHMGHCLELLHDPKAQQKYKREAEVTTMEEAQKEL